MRLVNCGRAYNSYPLHSPAPAATPILGPVNSRAISRQGWCRQRPGRQTRCWLAVASSFVILRAPHPMLGCCASFFVSMEPEPVNLKAEIGFLTQRRKDAKEWGIRREAR